MTAAESHPVLLKTLAVAVPLHMWELDQMTDMQRMAIGRSAADVVAAHGDDLCLKAAAEIGGS